MKNIALIILVVFGSLTLNAQVKYGPLIGVGFADNNYGQGIDLSIGAFAEFELLDRFGVRPEVSYASKRGWKDELNDQSSINENIKSNLKYIEIPILFYFRITPNLNMLLGPQFNSALGGDLTTKPDNGDAVDSSVDGHGGVGYVFGFEKSTFSRMKIGLRFSNFSYKTTEDVHDNTGNVLTIKATMRYSFDW